MKKMMMTILAALAAVGAASFAMHTFASEDRDWNRDMANAGKDAAVMLKYQPTDGASHGGRVRAVVTHGVA